MLTRYRLIHDVILIPHQAYEIDKKQRKQDVFKIEFEGHPNFFIFYTKYGLRVIMNAWKYDVV